MLSLTLLRHGLIDERPFVLWGQLDPPVSERGRADMQAAVAAAPQPWAGVITSPLQRCRIFAEDFSRVQKLDLRIEPDLMELHCGEWQGRTSAELFETDGDRYRAFTEDAERIVPPGGESLPEFRHRVLSCLQRWRSEAVDGHWLCVTHGGVLRVVLREWLGLQQHWRIATPPATAIRFALYEGGDPVLLSLSSPITEPIMEPGTV